MTLLEIQAVTTKTKSREELIVHEDYGLPNKAAVDEVLLEQARPSESKKTIAENNRGASTNVSCKSTVLNRPELLFLMNQRVGWGPNDSKKTTVCWKN